MANSILSGTLNAEAGFRHQENPLNTATENREGGRGFSGQGWVYQYDYAGRELVYQHDDRLTLKP